MHNTVQRAENDKNNATGKNQSVKAKFIIHSKRILKNKRNYCYGAVDAPELIIAGATLSELMSTVGVTTVDCALAGVVSAPERGRVVGIGGGTVVDLDRDEPDLDGDAGAPDEGLLSCDGECDGAKAVDCGRVLCCAGVDAAAGPGVSGVERRLEVAAVDGDADVDVRACCSAAACCSASCRVRSTSTSTYTVRRDSLLFASLFFFSFFSLVDAARSGEGEALSARVLPGVNDGPKSKSA